MTKSLKVKKGHNGVFQFTVCMNGMGKTALDAWLDVCDGINSDGLGGMPQRKDIELIELVDDMEDEE
jgi:hypothetical protein